MIFHAEHQKNRIILRARAEGDDAIGDAVFEVNSGETFLGVPYDAIRAKGEGEIRIEEEDKVEQ